MSFLLHLLHPDMESDLQVFADLGFHQIDQIKIIKRQNSKTTVYLTKYKHTVFLIHCISCGCTVYVSFPHHAPSSSNVNVSTSQQSTIRCLLHRALSSSSLHVLDLLQMSLLLSVVQRFERQTATDHHKGKGHPQASGRLQRSNCPCDQPGDKRATSFRRPEEDPGLCSRQKLPG